MSTKPRHLFLDHSIVGQSALTNFELNKEREYAFCRICGAIFQSPLAQMATEHEYRTNPEIKLAMAIETRAWRQRHNRQHPDHVHKSLEASGRFLTPDAAHRLAPYGIAPISDMMDDDEIEDATASAPRAPVAEVQTK